jgi:hypothetical protein
MTDLTGKRPIYGNWVSARLLYVPSAINILFGRSVPFASRVGCACGHLAAQVRRRPLNSISIVNLQVI